MLTQYLHAALDRARYEIIEDEEPFYGEVPELPGVWATGETPEVCRRNLASAVEDWILFRVCENIGHPVPRTFLARQESRGYSHALRPAMISSHTLGLAKGLPIPTLGDVVLRQPRLVAA
jgi:predicted RNase H-like HicB family nuclease